MKLSEHFDLSEFACKCGCGGERAPEIAANLKRVAAMLEKIRAALGNKPITVTSGYRCTKHNARVGGKPQSLHLTGRAADIQVADLSPAEVQDKAEDVPEAKGIGKHPKFTHLDVRPERRVFTY